MTLPPKSGGKSLEIGAAEPGRRSSVAGRIESLGLPVILQFLSQKEKSGRLALTRRDGHGIVLFHEGRIVAVSSGSVRDTFGNMLVCRGLISEADLMQAIETQHLSLERKRLGAILVEAGCVTTEDVERVVMEQMKAELAALIEWPSGFFRFDPIRIDGPHDVELNAQEFVSEGVSAERLLLSLMQQDEAEAPKPAEPGPPEQQSARPVSAILSELPVPALRGEVTLTLMRFAERTVARGVLYLLRSDQLAALVEFGFGRPGGDTQTSLSGLHLGLGEAGILAEVIQSKESFLGPVGPVSEDGGLVRVFGATAELLAIPLVVGDVAAGVFVGDNGPGGGAIRGVRPLELVVAEAGLEMERVAVEARLERYKAVVSKPSLLRVASKRSLLTGG
jgi:hypothetical protein